MYGSEYGRAAGAVINSVTNSGTNELHGQVYFYDRQSNWAAYNAFTKISVLNPTTGQYVSTPIKPEDERKIYGFTVGGPILKNKLFWMYTFDEHHRTFPGTAVPTSASTFYTLPNAALPTGVTCAAPGNGLLQGTDSNPIDPQVCLLAARQTAAGNPTTFAQAAAIWDAQIAALNGNLGRVPRSW